MEYVVVLEQAPNNWAAYVPDLPGCIATGKTREKTEQLIRQAIAQHLAALRAYDEPVSLPGTWTTVVDVDEKQVAELTEEFLAERDLPSADAVTDGKQSRVRPV